MGQDLSQNERKEVNQFLLNSLLTIKGNGDASVSLPGGHRIQDINKVSDITTLRRMKSKRQKKYNVNNKNSDQTNRSLNMMTVDDQLFSKGESSDVAFMTRHIGILSDAEHYGRL